jgi:hypothetical protein
METMFVAPSATAFDALTSIASAGIYVIVALAVLAHAPRDPRARLFLATAIASIAPYLVTAQIWAWGFERTFTKATIALLTLSLMIGSLALLHFTQLFPWRRPWIRRHEGKLLAGYVIAALLVAGGAILTPSFDMVAGAGGGGIGAVSSGMVVFIALVVFGILLPTLLIVGVVIPLGGLLSLYKSFLAARKHGIEAARVTTLVMLISQLGGGVLTILIIPLLRLVAPTGPLVTFAAALLFACSMLMPIAFAYGVWKLGVLGLDIDALPQ